MNDDDIWELASKPVTEFVGAIKGMELNVDKLVKFYLEHRQQEQFKTIGQAGVIEGGSEKTNKQTLSPLACAKLELAIVFAINTCYWVYLVTHGEDPGKNEISKDLERIRLFMNRAREVEESLLETSYSAKRPKIDKEASKRLCMNNISLKSNWS